MTTGTKPAPSASAASSDAGARAFVGVGDAGVSYPLIGALYMQTPIMDQMDLPTREQEEGRRHGRPDNGPRRIGYLRRGAKVPVLPQPHYNDKCREGWYELVQGGFVCARYATLDMNHPKLLTAPHPPFLDQPLPYQYAYNIANGTPLYRTIPSRKDRLVYEPWLVRRPRRKIALDDLDAGTVAAATTSATDTVLGFSFGADVEDAGVPWYLRDWDGGRPQVTLDDLKEDDGGPIVRRMVKGFYVSLDKDIEVDHVKWWKTTAGYLAPYYRMIVAKPPTDFHGVWLNTPEPPPYPPAVAQPDGGAPPYWVDKPPTHLPLAFVRWHAHEYTMSDDQKHVTRSKTSLSRFTPLQLTGEKKYVGNGLYYEVDGGYWMRAETIIVMDPGPAPADLKPNEKWIDVNLDNQSLVAFVGTTPVYATLVSSGRMDDHDKQKDHRTPPGDFRIREKHIAATMDGDVASDGPYSIEDVPWIMYFNQSIALHGAFWHSNFGHVQSHGCVNLSPDDARALFNWTDPQLPTGWHAVWATPEHPGTRVIVHTKKPKPHWDTDDDSDAGDSSTTD